MQWICELRIYKCLVLKRKKKFISYSETPAKCLKWFFANLKSELLLTKKQKTKVLCEIKHFSFFQETGENFSFCLVPSVGYTQTCSVICLVNINTFFIFDALISFSEFLMWPRTWKLDAKTIKMGTFLTSWLVFNKNFCKNLKYIIRISSHFKQLPFAF